MWMPSEDPIDEEGEEEESMSTIGAAAVAAAALAEKSGGAVDPVARLGKLKLFQGCRQCYLREAVRNAEQYSSRPGQEVQIDNLDAMILVRRGAIRVSVGSGDARVFGPGAVFNAWRMLRLGAEVDSYAKREDSDDVDDPRFSNLTNGWEIGEENGDTVPLLFQPDVAKASGEAQVDKDAMNFYNLCPFAARLHLSHQEALAVQEESLFRRSGQGSDFLANLGARAGCREWMSLYAYGADSNEVPTDRDPSAFQKDAFAAGGADIILFSRKVLEDISQPQDKFLPNALAPSAFEVIKKDMEYSFAVFQKNAFRLTLLWRALMSKLCKIVFPWAPPEAIWKMAVAAEDVSVASGNTLVNEGDHERSDDMFLITQGLADVEKLRAAPPSASGAMAQPIAQTMGRLKAGAIVGDFSLIGASMIRPATLRARTHLEAIRLPSKELTTVLQHFPGMLTNCKHRLQQVSSFLVMRLPRRFEVTQSLALFRNCDHDFIQELSSNGEHRALACGQVCIEEGQTHGDLGVLQYGKCVIEVASVGRVAEVPTGNCFGERILLGIAKHANATVRVTTPLALLLTLSRPALDRALKLHPAMKPEIDAMKEQPMEGRVKGNTVVHIELFRGCSSGFLSALNPVIEARTYMPGATIVLQGQTEQDPCMFLLKGGQAVVERFGKEYGMLCEGAMFGELTMLGWSHERRVTVRSSSLSYVQALPRSAFLKVLEGFPNEEQHFDKVQYGDLEVRTPWPCIHLSKLNHLMSLYAEKRKTDLTDTSLSRQPAKDSAILVLKGKYVLVDSKTGDELMELSVGDCHNERVLAGCTPKNCHLETLEEGEVAILGKETWEKVLGEFPQENARVIDGVCAYLASKCEKVMGFAAGSVALFDACSVFGCLGGQEFLSELRKVLEPQLHEAGSNIVGQHRKGDRMFIVLEGVVLSGDGETILPRSIFGEGVLLGVEQSYPSTYRASTFCTLYALSRRNFEKTLEAYAEQEAMVYKLRRGMRKVSTKMLQERLQDSVPFSEVRPECVELLCRKMSLSYFLPGQVICKRGSACGLGTSSFHLILGGQATVHAKYGASLGVLQPGDVFGFPGAFGLVANWPSTIKAWDEGLMCAAAFSPSVVQMAVKEFPVVKEHLSDMHKNRAAIDGYIELQRRRWLEDVAVPALGQAQLLSGCPVDFLMDIAVTLTETEYPAGRPITRMGDATRSMLILLTGAADVVARNGEHICRLAEGSSFGEVAALGLFPTRMATIRAVTSCRVLEVTEDALRTALRGPKGRGLVDAFEALVQSRRQQVATGMPLTSLNVGATTDNVAVRAIALTSERILLEAGEVLAPCANAHLGGPTMGVLAKGHGIIEMNGGLQKVTDLFAGSLILEGIISDYGAQVRAQAFCEGYRIRENEMQIAVSIQNSGQKEKKKAADLWIFKFKLLVREVQAQLIRQLTACRGLVEGLAPKGKDRDIKGWSDSRQQAMERAERIRVQRKEVPMGKLPPMMKNAIDGGPEVIPGGRRKRLRAIVVSPSLPSLTSRPQGRSEGMNGRAGADDLRAVERRQGLSEQDWDEPEDGRYSPKNMGRSRSTPMLRSALAKTQRSAAADALLAGLCA